MSAIGTGQRVAVKNVRQVRVDTLNPPGQIPGAGTEVKFVLGSLSSGFKNALVAATTGKAIRVLTLWVIGDGTYKQQLKTGTVTAQGTGGTALTPLSVWPVAGKRWINEHGICQTAAGAALSLDSSNAAATATVLIAYVLV